MVFFTMKNWAKISDFRLHTLKVISRIITLNIWPKIGPVCLYMLLYKITTKRIVKNTYFCLFFALKCSLPTNGSFRKLTLPQDPRGITYRAARFSRHKSYRKKQPSTSTQWVSIFVIPRCNQDIPPVHFCEKTINRVTPVCPAFEAAGERTEHLPGGYKNVLPVRIFHAFLWRSFVLLPAGTVHTLKQS